jgi:CheY-like chemotaxis protein
MPLSPQALAQLGAGVAAREDAAPAPAPAPAAAAWPPGTTVLLVEDNPVNQLIGQEFLHTLGLSARTVSDGEQALKSCVEQPPSLVLMDLQMPGIDGLEATRQLRALQRAGRWPGAPIIALTAHAASSERAACLAAGMDGVLTKPLSLQTLAQELRHWLAPDAGAG